MYILRMWNIDRAKWGTCLVHTSKISGPSRPPETCKHSLKYEYQAAEAGASIRDSASPLYKCVYHYLKRGTNTLGDGGAQEFACRTSQFGP